MSQINLLFNDEAYSSTNKPSTAVLSNDLAAIQSAHNDTDSNAIKRNGTVSMTGNLNMGGQSITNAGNPTSDSDVATLGSVYPIGSVYLAVVDTDPSVLLGFGTWVRIAEGRLLAGQEDGDTNFGTSEQTGGQKTRALTLANMPAHAHSMSHTHPVNPPNTTATKSGGSFGSLDMTNEDGGSSSAHVRTATGSVDYEKSISGTFPTYSVNIPSFTSGASSISSTGSQGSGTSFDTLNPYFVVYTWKRTA